MSHLSHDHPHTRGPSWSLSKLPLSLLAGFRTRPEPERRQTGVGKRHSSEARRESSFPGGQLAISKSTLTYHLRPPRPRTRRWPYTAGE